MKNGVLDGERRLLMPIDQRSGIKNCLTAGQGLWILGFGRILFGGFLIGGLLIACLACLSGFVGLGNCRLLLGILLGRFGIGRLGIVGLGIGCGLSGWRGLRRLGVGCLVL